MIERYLKTSDFSSTEEFAKGFHIDVPDNFNFAFDIVDGWAAQHPEKRALCWVNEHGLHHDFTFGEMKRLSDAAASFFQSIGIGRGDMVMLMLKRRYEFWVAILGLHKIGAVAIPATHLLTPKDIEYRHLCYHLHGRARDARQNQYCFAPLPNGETPYCHRCT